MLPPWDLADDDDEVSGDADQLEAHGRDFFLRVDDLGEDAFTVVAFEGQEQLNGLYAFDVTATTAATVDLEPGQRARLRIPGAAGERVVHGVLSRVRLLGTTGARSAYRVRISPAMSLLGKTRDSRVFQHLSVPDVVREVLGATAVGVVFALARTYPPRTYCVQYEESDLDFVFRLLAEEGLASHFEHFATVDEARHAGFDRAEECLVVLDAPGARAPISGPPALAVRAGAGALDGREHDVLAFHLTRRLEPTQVSVREHDPRRASARSGERIPSPAAGAGARVHAGITGATAGRPGREVLDHHGAYEDLDASPVAAEVRLEQLRRREVVGEGRTRSRRLLPGRVFELTGHERDGVDGRYVVTRARHEGRPTRGAAGDGYTCHFSCAPASSLARPERPARRVVQSMETAIVVGARGQEIATEPHGSVKVQFHWDRRGAHDERSSCWVRVAQPWSGPGFGFQFIPRVGAEVLVGFVGGDPDRPVVMGSLPNLANQLSHELPERASRSGIRTRSTPHGDGGHNEILFEDEKGAEFLRLRAERDLEEIVLRNHRVQVGGATEIQIAGSRSQRVEGADATEIGGNATRRVAGDLVDRVGGGLVVAVGAGRRAQVAGGDSLAVGGDSTVRIAGHALFVAGTAEVADLVLQTSGTVRVVGAGAVRVVSPQGVEIACGSSSIHLTPDGIVLRGKSIRVEGTDQVVLAHATTSIAVTDAVDVRAKEVFLSGEAAELKLGRNAELLGQKVNLGRSASAAGKGEPVDEAKRGNAIFRVTPPAGHEGPMTLRIATPTGEVIERDTDADNEVALEGAPGEHFVLLGVRVDGRVLHAAPIEED